jgi:hypothetical protein
MKKLILILCLLIPTYAHARAYETDLFWNDRCQTEHDDVEACYQSTIKNNIPKFNLYKRMSELIHRWKLKHDQGAWIECGKKIKNKTKSLQRARIINASEKVSDENYTLIPWTLVAIYANESVFDECALGPAPRKWAYKRGLVKKRRILSHYKQDVIKIITDKKAKRAFGRSGFDLGPCQLLSRFYRGSSLDMIDVSKGSLICAKEAVKRGLMHDVKQPQLLWPNGNPKSRRAKKYRRWVNSRLRRMGVTTAELFNDNLYYKTTPG